MGKEKVSIIIPVHNIEKYIDRCIRSIINQSYRNIEIILVDDGSTDSSPQIVDRWGFKDKRIRCIHQENGGLSAARNAGIKLATGQYILFVDGDDYVSENCIFSLIETVHQYKNGVDVVCFPYYRVFKCSKVFTKLFESNRYFEQSEVREIILQKLIGPSSDTEKLTINDMDRLNTAWGKLYRTQLVKNHSFTDTKIIGPEDGWFNVQIFFEAKNAVYTEDCYYCYEKNNERSLLHTYDDNYYLKRKKLYNLMETFLLKNQMEKWNDNLKNREVLEFFSIALKVADSNLTLYRKIEEINRVLEDEDYINAIKRFPFNHLSFGWKVFWKMCEKRKSEKILGLITVYLKGRRMR